MPRRSVEVSARSVDDAVTQALAELGLSRDEVEIEVLREASRGVLGFGAEDAVVLISEREASPESAVRPEADVAEGAREDEPVEPLQEAPADADETVAQVELAQVSAEVLETLVDKMGLEASVAATEGKILPGETGPAPILLDIRGQDLGILIGRRGETLRDLQFVTRLIVQRRLGYWPNLVVDVEGYKARRKEMLTGLALRMADKAVETRRTVTLEPMPAYERRIIHVALRDHPQVTTESIGQGDSRKVTIILKD